MYVLLYVHVFTIINRLVQSVQETYMLWRRRPLKSSTYVISMMFTNMTPCWHKIQAQIKQRCLESCELPCHWMCQHNRQHRPDLHYLFSFRYCWIVTVRRHSSLNVFHWLCALSPLVTFYNNTSVGGDSRFGLNLSLSTGLQDIFNLSGRIILWSKDFHI